MKKITLLAALLGSAYFANAQVGIGTPTPHASAILDVTATNKGVLIPRVELKNTTTVLSTGLVQEESLLVYNTATGNGVTPGFYYWVAEKGSVDAHWERIVNQSQLDTAITNVTNLQGDVTKIKELLNYVYPSNNLGDSTLADGSQGGGMIYSPATATDPAKIEYVYYNGTEYVKQDLSDVLADIIDPANGSVFYNNIGTETAPEFVFQYWDASLNNGEGGFTTITISEIVQANETKTKIQTIEGKQFYFAENFEGTIPTSIPTSLPAGMYLIDVVGGVVNNFNEILNQDFVTPITINGTTINDIKEYIQYLSETSDANVGFTVGGIDATANNGVAIPANSFYYIDKTTGNKVHIDLAALVKDLETDTQITKNVTGTVNAGNLKIDYKYFNEAQPDTTGTPQQVIEITADMVTSITNNTDVQNAISNVLNQGGNVYYGDVNGENVFYTIVYGVKTPVEISQVVVNAITSATTIQKQEIKNQLGDTYSTTTVVNTGDTWVDGGAIYKGIYETIVLGGTANITGATAATAGSISISAPSNTTLGDVISIKILNKATNSLITESVTDVKLENGNLYFRIGTGTMYNVLSATDLVVNVLVEFSAITITTP